MAEGGEKPAAKGLPKLLSGKTFSGALIVAALAAAFFVFYVSPQSQYERDRIYRSMNDVSRLLDDRTQAADQAFQTWNCMRGDASDRDACYKNLVEGRARIEKESQSELPGFAFGCERTNIICVSLPPKEQWDAWDSRSKEASISLQSIAQDARLPYSQAILLIMNANGEVLAGHDRDGKWAQFQTLGALIGNGRDAAAQAKADPGGGQLGWLIGTAQRTGRGAENAVFEGYPARLSRDIGGQGYSIFIAAFKMGRSQSATGQAAESPTSIWIKSASDNPDNPGGGGAAKQDAGRPKDVLYFAYVVPDRVIDSAALHIPSEWTVNLLLLLLCVLLSIPFLKLFSRSPLKPIRPLDLGALLISIMLIVTTATLSLTAIIMKNSVAGDIQKELGFIARSVAGAVSDEANRFAGTDSQHASEELSDLIAKGSQRGEQTDGTPPPWTPASAAQLEKLAQLQSAFAMGKSGSCATEDTVSDCGKGLWFTKAPQARQVTITDRAYHKAWRNGDPALGTSKFVQFLRSKSNGRLSWSYMLEAPPEATPDGTTKRRGFVVSAMPLALRVPVLPRNFSFMVVLNTDLPEMLKSPGSEHIGDVQYHSDQPRSLIENVLREARDDPQLAAALWALRDASASKDTDEQSGNIPITYHGQSYYALVRPVAGMPYSVIALFDRTEAQGLFAQTTAQSVFLSCCWILLCILVCWVTPRAMRWTRGPHLTDDERAAPLRARAMWFFPNGLCPQVPGGFTFASRAGREEFVLLGVTLAAQLASYHYLPPTRAVCAIGLVSLVALIGEYLLIARPCSASPLIEARRAIIFATAILAAVLLYAILTGMLGSGGFLVGMLIVAGLAAGAGRYARDRFTEAPPRIRRAATAEWNRTQVASIRRAFLSRAFVLLLVVVAVPSFGFLSMAYNENLKGYVGASLITASERIAEQRVALRKDIDQRFRVSPDMAKALGLQGFDAKHRPPGWFLSETNEGLSGIFSVLVATQPARTVHAAPGSLVADFLEMVTPYYGSADSDVRDSRLRVQESRHSGARWFTLAAPGDFVAPGTRLDGNDEALTLRAGPIDSLPLHPDWSGTLTVLFCALVFVAFFYTLLKTSATYLTGLHLSPLAADPAVRRRLDAQIDRDPRKAWEAVASDGQKARLLALATMRSINFCDRAPIQELVEQGYLDLTPYVHIANPRLRDFLHYDLPRAERDAVMRAACGHDDHWEHMRLPVFIGLGAACVLLAYTSPDAIQLVMSAFLALTALLPLTQDPVSRFLGTARAA